MLNALLFYTIAFIFILIIAYIKAAFGGGFSILIMPFMTFLLNGKNATALVGILVVFIDIILISSYKSNLLKFLDKNIFFILCNGMFFGIVIGIFLFIKIDVLLINFLIGTITLFYSANWILKYIKTLKKGVINFNNDKLKNNKTIGICCGIISGFTSFVGQSGGPPIAYYMLQQSINKETYLITSILIFAFGNSLKLCGYLIVGCLSKKIFLISIFLMPAALIGIWIGKNTSSYLTKERIFFICHFFLLISSVFLITHSLLIHIKI